MYHEITFVKDFIVDEAKGASKRLEKVKMKEGQKVYVKIYPYVQQTSDGFHEMANLDHGGGMFVAVPMSTFTFLSENEN